MSSPLVLLSSHPVDVLIREVIGTRRSVRSDEIGRILDHIGTAEFDPRAVRVPIEERGVTYGSRQLQSLDDSLFVHLVRRVVLDQEWSVGTTGEDYVRDLRLGTQADGVRLVVYSRRGGSIAGILASTSTVVSELRLGPGSLPELFVVYSADRGVIVSGYQAISKDALAIPEDAQWLR